MILTWVTAACTIGLNVFGHSDMAVWSSLLVVCFTIGQGYFTSKTNGITRELVINNNRLSERNNDLAEKNNELLARVNGQVSGGDSFAYVVFSLISIGMVRAILFPQGENNLFNLDIQIFLNSSFLRMPISFNFAEINKSQTLTLGEMRTDTNAEHHYYIKFTAPETGNGFKRVYSQCLNRMKKAFIKFKVVDELLRMVKFYSPIHP